MGDDWENEVQVQEHEYPDTTDDIFTFVKCKKCNAVYLNPRPTIEELPTIYPSNYYAFDLASETDSKASLSPKSISAYFEKRRIRKSIQQFSVNTPKNVFDIGSGDGFSLQLFREIIGQTVVTAGIEMSDVAAEKARQRGHQVVTGLFEEFNSGKDKYDIVFSSHVIEHVASPKDFLLKARELMSDDGILIIDTPNVDSPLRTIFGRHWGGWHTPRHWTLFDPETFQILADKCNLRIVNIDYMPINMYWVWGLHSVLFKKNRKIADKLFDPINSVKGGVLSIVLLTTAQILELVLKLLTRKTSQMRLTLKVQSSENL